MKKIGILIPDFAVGGMPKVASDIIHILKEKYNIKLILLNSESKILFDTHKVEIIKLYPLGKSKISKIITYLMRITKFKKINKTHDFDYIISFGVAANLINILGGNKQTKKILTEHSIKSIENSSWGAFGKIYNVFMKIFYNKANAIITVSNGIEEDLIQNYNITPSIVKTIYNPMNIAKIRTLSEVPLPNEIQEILNGKLNILTVGRLSQEKGLITVLKVVKELKREFGNIQAVFLGEGILKEQISIWSKKLQIEDSVKILGFTSNPFNIMKQCDVLMLTSLNEGFPNVLNEAIITSTPVIATDCLTGPREILLKKSNYKDEINQFLLVKEGILTRRLKSDTYNSISDLTDEEYDILDAVKFFFSNRENWSQLDGENDMVDIQKIGKQYLDLLKSC